MNDKRPTSCIYESLHHAGSIFLHPHLVSTSVLFERFTRLISTASLYTTFLNLPGASLAICNHCISDIFIATECLAFEKENKRRKLTLFLASARSLTIRSQLSPTPRPYLRRLRQLSQNRYHRPLPLVPRLKKSHSSTERRNSSATSRQ
jgi:hypothetical protein